MITTTHIFHVAGMHCGSCALLIDDTIEDLPGVQSAHTDLKSGRSTVDLHTTVTTPQQIVDTIIALGYTATEHP